MTEEEADLPLGSAFGWTHAGRANDSDILDDEHRVEPVHPVFVIPFKAVERTRTWFRERGGF